MPLHHPRHPAGVRVGAVAALAVLALAGCGGDAPSGPQSPTAASSSSSPSSSSGTSSPSRSSTSPSPSTNLPDPEVSVTPSADPTQSPDERAAGTRAADGSAAATRLAIPSVGLSTRIGPQGLRGGKVNPAAGEVIWFTGYDRVRPGAVGTTVVAGHVISGGQADEFAALEELAVGDGVVLTYPGGARLRFEVTSTEVVDKDELTTRPEVWGKNSDTRRIVLVTCDDELGFREDGHRKANFVAVAELPD